MPELPEVETVVRRVRPAIVGRRITSFESHWPRQCQPSVAEVRRSVVGRTVGSVTRRGKWIVLELERNGSSAGCLLIHLRMSGRLEIAARGEQPRHSRAEFGLSDRRVLHFCDARKFGRLWAVQRWDESGLGIGVEPLSRAFTAARLATLLDRPRRLKPLLLDQAIVAGLGNIYTDEALFRARLHPNRPANSLSRAEVSRLHAAIQYVLRKSIRLSGTSIDWVYPDGGMEAHLQVYGRASDPCPACGAPIQYLRIAQRGTHVCKVCQPLQPAPAGDGPARRKAAKRRG